MQPTNTLSLLEFNTLLKGIIRENTDNHYWVVAEISELKVNYSGHCYIELVQNDSDSDKILARSRATIWSQTYRMIKPYFETTTGQTLAAGLSVLVKVRIEFHEVYGLSLNITDIEPTYTVGELAIQKQKVIERLIQEGVLEMNRELLLPQPLQKIAVVSSKTAAGYGDFADQLSNNSYGYKFYYKLFPAVMQGAEAERSIIAALDRIYAFEDIFDAVVLIRGGGSQLDLNCFNSYWLASHIAQFPLPVITGIGHEQDDTIADLVAHSRLKTPTAVAAFLIENMAMLEEEVDDIGHGIMNIAAESILTTRQLLQNKSVKLTGKSKSFVQQSIRTIDRFESKFAQASKSNVARVSKIIQRQTHRLGSLSDEQIREQQFTLRLARNSLKQKSDYIIEKNIRMLDGYSDKNRMLNPQILLERGYSITYHNNMPVKDPESIAEGDIIETQLSKGKITSKVKK